MQHLNPRCSQPEALKFKRDICAALTASSFFSILCASAEILFPIILGLALDNYLGDGLTQETIVYLSAAILALIFSPVFLYLTVRTESIVIPKILVILRNLIWSNQLKMTTRSNSLASSQQSGTSLLSVSAFLENDLAEFLYLLSLILLSLIFLCYQSLSLTLFSLAILAFTALLAHFFSPQIEAAEESYQNLNGQFFRAVGQPALRRREFFNSLLKRRFEKQIASLSISLDADFKAVLYSRIKLIPLYELTAVVIFSTSLVYLFFKVVNSEITPGEAISTVLALELLVGGLSKLGRFISGAYRALADLRIANSSSSSLDFKDINLRKLQMDELENEYAVAFKELGVRTPDGRSLFNGVNAEFSFGSVVALVGANGVGKTSLLDAIANITEYEGNIVFSKRLSTFENTDSLIYYSPQDAVLLLGGLLENILCRDDHGYTLKSLTEDVQTVFGPEFLPKVDTDFDGWFKKEEQTISKGEAKVISLLRAYYSGAPVLLLDEVTAYLDTERLQCLVRAIKFIRPNGVVFIAGHSQEISAMADYVITLTESKVIISSY